LKHWDAICEDISLATGNSFVMASKQSIGGGCINETYKLTGKNGEHWFVKLNDASGLAMFEAEKKGLQEMANTRTIRVPNPVCAGIAEKNAYLVMEYIDLASRGADPTKLGQQFAAMHQTTSTQFGWEIENTIGSTPQINTYENNWIEFWRKHRLGFQLQLAARGGGGRHLQRKGDQLMDTFPDFFTDYQPKASLLHGDCWGGNCSGDRKGNPVIYDPAVYYGDHEADLAMTELFGGFGQTFYSAYAEVFPIDSGYSVRKILYNLYHILNHFNIFGGGYAMQAESMMDQLLAELGA
jgi:fructosamine-3-kinase